MTRRVAAFALTLIVAGAPCALTACGIACAAHASRSSSGTKTHTCHDTHPSDAPAVQSDPHVCRHESEMPSAAKTTVPVYGPLVDAVQFLAVLRARPLESGSAPSVSVSAPSKLLIPLRI